MSRSEPSPTIRPTEGRSHVRGPILPPLVSLTVSDCLNETASRWPDRPAVIFCDRELKWTWSQFEQRVDALASGLHALGLVAGDRVAIWGSNSPEWLLTQFATARLGLVLVTINPAYRLAEVSYALNKVACRAIVIAQRFKSSDYVAMMQALAPELARHSLRGHRLQAKTLPALEYVIQLGAPTAPGMLAFDEIMRLGLSAGTGRLEDISGAVSPLGAINIQFTSGTTGAPKGATLTHHNIVNNARFCVSTMNFTEADRLCIPVPLYHCFGMVMGVLGCVSMGSCMVFPAEAFDAEATLKAIARERCTAIYGVPTMFTAMLDHVNFRDYDTTSLRTGIMAGAPCPIELMRRVVSDMHVAEITIAYGMTETSPVSFQSAIDDPIERRVATVGRVHPHVEVKLVDETGQTVPVGATGEICCRGYSVMQGYWDDDTRTREAIVDGWMHTGDLGVIDKDGYARVVGRLKDMVIRGGENIYPREIEEFLLGHPGISQVQVFGVPDDKFGEELCAWIVRRPGHVPTEAEIRAFCQDKIAHYKVPKHIRFKSELPLTVTGKAQKYKMREAMIAELGLVEPKHEGG